jgi:hypothetical protein
MVGIAPNQCVVLGTKYKKGESREYDNEKFCFVWSMHRRMALKRDEYEKSNTCPKNYTGQS